jgi:sugar/nucleoside kinase (ribokinase family)
MFVSCGGLRTDYVITADGEARLRQMGGNAIFSAGGARLWRDDVAMLGRVGDNFPVEWFEAWRKTGIDVRGIRNVGGQQDHRTFYAYIDQHTRDDTRPDLHFARIGQPLPEALADYVHSTPGQDNPDAYEPLAVTPDDLEAFHGQSVAALHIAPISIRTQRHVPPAARALGCSCIGIDPGERTMRPSLMAHIERVLAQIDVFMPSDMEVRSLFEASGSRPDYAAWARWFAERGPQVVIIKLGPDGSLIHERGGAVWQVPAYPTQVIDVTGAGDSYGGAYMAVYANTGDPVRAACAAAATASFTIEDYGATRLLMATPAAAEARAAVLRGAVVWSA